ncbi:hypothetical protein FACS1894109_11010 [Spirochaetia bacterium]|nr:hypothetical protein FACS1894109_11010 [Spirochaetia bacterium]
MGHTEKTLEEKWASLYLKEDVSLSSLPVKGWQRIEAKVLDLVLEYTYRASSKDYNRYYINGVCIENVKGGLRGIATNGSHLALVDVPCKLTSFRASRLATYGAEKYKKEISHIIPLQYISRLRQILKLSKTWDILIKNEYMALRQVGGSRVCQFSFVEGDFPNYQRVIPEENNIMDTPFKMLQVDMPEVLDALKSFKKLPWYPKKRDDPWQIWFKVDSLTELILSSVDPLPRSRETAAHEDKSLDIYTQAEPITEFMNGRHLEHVCASIKGTAQFEWQKDGKAWQIKPVVLDKELSKLLFVTMPLNKGCY